MGENMFVAWPDIKSFQHVRRAVVKYPNELLKGRNKVYYQAKVKLHGTNAGIFCKAGRFTAQSRTTAITSGNDNAGFAAWVESQAVQDALVNAYSIMPSDMVIYGEWCGPGIQKGVAVCQIPKRSFAVFAALLLNKRGEPTDDLVVEPTELAKYVEGVPDTYVLPWYKHSFVVDLLETAERLEPLLTDVNGCVAEVEEEDPWVYANFGVKGTGEGLVYYPMSHQGRENFGNLAFKAKGKKHQVIAHAKPAQANVTAVWGVSEFAQAVLTPARLEQGARAVNKGEFKCEPRLIGPFLAWVSGDVQKECQAELEESSLTWKQVQKVVADVARKWYIEKSNEL